MTASNPSPSRTGRLRRWLGAAVFVSGAGLAVGRIAADFAHAAAAA